MSTWQRKNGMNKKKKQKKEKKKKGEECIWCENEYGDRKEEMDHRKKM